MVYAFMSGNISCSRMTLLVTSCLLSSRDLPAASSVDAPSESASENPSERTPFERLVKVVSAVDAPALSPFSDTALSSTSPRCALPDGSKPELSSSRADALIESSVSLASLISSALERSKSEMIAVSSAGSIGGQYSRYEDTISHGPQDLNIMLYLATHLEQSGVVLVHACHTIRMSVDLRLWHWSPLRIFSSSDKPSMCLCCTLMHGVLEECQRKSETGFKINVVI